MWRRCIHVRNFALRKFHENRPNMVDWVDYKALHYVLQFDLESTFSFKSLSDSHHDLLQS
jgi:hypothetical protein